MEAQLRSKHDPYLWTHQMGNWAHGKGRGEGCDVLEQSQAAAAGGVDRQTIDRWRPAFRGTAAFAVRAGGRECSESRNCAEAEVEEKGTTLDLEGAVNRLCFSLLLRNSR